MTCQKQAHERELSELHPRLKALTQEKQSLDDALATLQPAHKELQDMHKQTAADLQHVQQALHKSEAARVHAEVIRPAPGGWCTRGQGSSTQAFAPKPTLQAKVPVSLCRPMQRQLAHKVQCAAVTLGCLLGIGPAGRWPSDWSQPTSSTLSRTPPLQRRPHTPRCCSRHHNTADTST